ncbi:hypothetical protein IC582_010165 [Cucumis melo]
MIYRYPRALRDTHGQARSKFGWEWDKGQIIVNNSTQHRNMKNRMDIRNLFGKANLYVTGSMRSTT